MGYLNILHVGTSLNGLPVESVGVGAFDRSFKSKHSTLPIICTYEHDCTLQEREHHADLTRTSTVKCCPLTRPSYYIWGDFNLKLQQIH